jgi:hypothetical protein
MSCVDFWDPVVNCMGIIIDALPAEKRLEVVERLQLLAEVFADRGDLMASNFARALSGEPFPAEKPKLRIVE